MKLVYLITFVSIISVQVQAKIDVNQLRCLVCQKTLDELGKQIDQIDPTKKVDVGGYRLDKDGNLKQKTVSQAKSEIHLSELMDSICDKMDDYVRATWKSNGELTLLKLIDNGQMNSQMSEVDIIQDDDLNKSLKYYCEGIVEEFEENIIKHYQKDTKDIHKQICVDETRLCPKLSKRNDEL